MLSLAFHLLCRETILGYLYNVVDTESTFVFMIVAVAPAPSCRCQCKLDGTSCAHVQFLHKSCTSLVPWSLCMAPCRGSNCVLRRCAAVVQ